MRAPTLAANDATPEGDISPTGAAIAGEYATFMGLMAGRREHAHEIELRMSEYRYPRRPRNQATALADCVGRLLGIDGYES